MMTEWSQQEETQFQELVRRAEAQSRAYHQRAVATAEPAWQPEPIREPPPPPPPPQPACWVNPSPMPMLPPPPPRRTAPASPPMAHAHKQKPKQTGGIAELLNIPGFSLPALDSETILLAALIWMLLEDEADIKLILALGYILLV